MIIYEYSGQSVDRYIDHPSKIPSTPSKIQVFFDGKYRPISKGLDMWPQLRIGLSIEEESFISDAKSLLEDKDMLIFKKDLQGETTEIIWYFLFSHIKQSRDRLKKMIQNIFRTECKIKDDISVR